MTEGKNNINPHRLRDESARLETPATLFTDRRLREILEGGTGTDPLEEMKRICSVLLPGGSATFLEQLHADLSRIFDGDFQGFRESHVKYHDLRHTRNVTLATVRLFHGLYREAVVLSPDIIKLGILCAYFHDTGMLLTEEDVEHSGAAYLKCHEQRSIAFARHYLHDHGFPAFYSDNCEAVINCTNLTLDPEDIAFASTEIELVGHVLGTADILAQMADRYYLECLPLLYLEQRDAGIQRHPSSLALMRQTTTFYHLVIEKRLRQGFKNRCAAMRTHFREWWQLDNDLYLEFIEKNIRYLEDVIHRHDSGEGDLKLYLRRQQPKR